METNIFVHIFLYAFIMFIIAQFGKNCKNVFEHKSPSHDIKPTSPKKWKMTIFSFTDELNRSDHLCNFLEEKRNWVDPLPRYRN